MSEDNLSYFERRITAELEEVEARIKELEKERNLLTRQLAKARADRTGLKHTTRKNSVNRVLAENSIIQSLRDSKKLLTTKQLYRISLRTNADLKESTFRSYLHRMKKRGDIKNYGNKGNWVLVK